MADGDGVPVGTTLGACTRTVCYVSTYVACGVGLVTSEVDVRQEDKRIS